MKEKISKIAGAITIVLIILFAILWYPWLITVDENKETTCSNLLGYKMNCR